MKMSFFTSTILLFVMLLISGCAGQTKLADYQPKSAEEQAVVDCMKKVNEAWAAEDIEKTLAHYHENAQIRIVIGADRNQPLVTKQQFKTYLKEGGFKKMPLNIMEEVKVREPVITITENRATIAGTSPASNVTINHKWDLVKEKDKWLIIKEDWWW
jgi:hypothetical protein